MTNSRNSINGLHNLCIGHCNIQGGLLNLGKSSELTQLIQDHKLDLLSLNELNLNETIHTSTINVPTSLNLIRCDRPNSSRGGCGLMISKKLAYTELNMNSKLDNIEAIWAKLKSSKINICSFYRSGNYCSVDNFVDYINFCMKKLNGKKVIWIGDINIDQNNISSSQYKKPDMALKSYNLVQTIRGITRVAKRGDSYSQTTIDVIFTNCYSDFVESSVLEERIGDHQAIMCEIDCKVYKAPKFEKVEIRNHSKIVNVTLSNS
jgi:exonuclease III